MDLDGGTEVVIWSDMKKGWFVMEKILVTGGAGFIGSRVCRKLLREGHEVMVYDSFTKYENPLDVYHGFCLEKRFEGIKDDILFYRGDTRDYFNLRMAVTDFKPSRILHLSANPIAKMPTAYNKEMLSVIVDGTSNLLEIVRELETVDRFVYVSSSMVYGNFLEVPVREDQPQNPMSVYGGAKYCGEVITKTFGFKYDLPYHIIRPSAVYGPMDTNRRVSQILVENALKGKPIKLDDMGKQVLDFSYVEDVANGMCLALLSNDSFNETFNITNGKGYSLLDFVDILKKHIEQVDVELIPEDPKKKIPKRGALSIEKARKMLGYRPEVDLEEGIKRYVEYYRSIGF